MAPDARKKLEQIRLSKKKKAITRVGDLRQLIKKKTNTTSPRSPERLNRPVAARLRPDSSGPRDLRDSNLRRFTRTNIPQPTRNNQSLNRLQSRPATTRFNTLNKKSSSSNGQLREKRYPDMQHYVPPHVQRNQPTYIIAPSTVNKAKPAINATANRASDTQGASILVSNLPPAISQSDIIQLFCEIGDMIAVNLINPTTAMVTYQNANDAVRAVKIYHSRLLDDKPMIVNMMPSTI